MLVRVKAPSEHEQIYAITRDCIQEYRQYLSENKKRIGTHRTDAWQTTNTWYQDLVERLRYLHTQEVEGATDLIREFTDLIEEYDLEHILGLLPRYRLPQEISQ